MKTSIIPVNTEGKPNDIERTVSLPGRIGAIEVFKTACYRLLHPSIWHELCGALSGQVTVIGAAGNEVVGNVRMGDYLRIDIPGPGTGAGDGYDWVKVEAIEDSLDAAADEEFLGMRVRPCANPQKEHSDAAHFFKREATSTFIINRKGNTVTASYHGRNETPNITTGKVLDNIRNALVAAGAMLGLSEAQWSALMKAFVENE